MAVHVCKQCHELLCEGQAFCPYCKKEHSLSSKTVGFVSVLALLTAAISFNLFRAPDKPIMPEKTSEEPKPQKLRDALDPPTKIPLKPKEHLKLAQRLLAGINIELYEDADVRVQLIAQHAAEAKKDARNKAQADLVLKRMAAKALDVVKVKAWNAPGAAITAQVVCKMSIKSRLKAPSTADWLGSNTARWRDHPGYFLTNYTVDAQNSFGAKLRGQYQCQVFCLSGDACQVTHISEVEQ